METFFIIAIITFVIFVMVQLTDTSRQNVSPIITKGYTWEMILHLK